MLESGECPRIKGRKMAIDDPRHRQRFPAPLERDLLNKAAHVTSGNGVREAVSQLGLDVLSEDPIELPCAALLALDLLGQISVWSPCADACPYGSAPGRSTRCSVR